MEKNEKNGAREAVIQFIQKFRIVLLVLLALIIGGIIVAIAYEEVTKASVAALTSMVEQLDSAHEAVLTAKTDEEKKTLTNDFDAMVKKASDSFKGTFAEQRAYFIKGSMLYADKSFSDAEIMFVKAATAMPNSYLAPVALLSAAFAAEDANNTVKAIEYLTKITKDYEKSSALVSRAWFNIGRINEAGQQYKDAAAAYQKIVETSAGSNWTKLAKDRIIYLETQQKL